MKAAKPRLIRLRKGRVPIDSELVRTLLWMLERAREGEVIGYAMVTLVETDGGLKTQLTEAAAILDPIDAHHMLGGIRRMEANFMKRQWPDD